MSWVYLFIAGFFEVAWAVGLKYSNGFKEVIPSVLTIIGIIASFYFLALSLKDLPLGTAYATWTGIGTIGTVFLGSILFEESISFIKILCIFLIIAGIVGLKLLTPQH